jgi:hypothetical protein
MSLATLTPGAVPGLAELVDGVAARTGAWVVVERFGAVVTHGTGTGDCPSALATSLLRKCTAELRAAVTWKRGRGALTGQLEGMCVTAADLGDGCTAWFVGAPADASALTLLAEAARSTGPVTDPVVEELLHPRGPARRGRAPRARLVVLRSDDPGLARRARTLVAGTEARVHSEDGLVLVALPLDGSAEQLVERLGADVIAGVADVPDDASDWVATCALASGSACAAGDLGLKFGRPEDPAVAGELVVAEAQAAVSELLRDLPGAPLHRLREHDARSGGELVASLTAWCRAGFDVPAAAAALHVHTNTLRYRLKRATEVSGLDVTRPRQLLALQLLLGV